MLALVRPYLLHIALGVAALGIVVGGYYFIRHQGVVAAEREQREREMAAYKAAAERAQAIAKELEDNLARAKAEANQLNERLTDELQKSPVYRDCRVPADGVQLLQRALAGPAAR